MFEWYLTIKTRRYKGNLTLWEFHIWRLYQKFIRPKVAILEREGKE
jgi:hypothetical protein